MCRPASKHRICTAQRREQSACHQDVAVSARSGGREIGNFLHRVRAPLVAPFPPPGAVRVCKLREEKCFSMDWSFLHFAMLVEDFFQIA
jgi:hypothetical protein